MRCRALAAVAIAASTLLPAAGHAASETPSPLDDVRLAKIGLAGFIVEHVDRPLRIAVPCPTLPVESAGGYLSSLGLVPSAREYGPAVVFESDIGAGVVALRCGNDLARPAEPPGSVALSTDVTMLDGQATFDQYAVDLGGNDVAVTDVAQPPGRQVARCTNGGSDCTAALAVDDLVVTVRLRGLPADTGEQLARQLVVAITPEVIANLTGLAATHE
jgi:hypothetical protein